MESTSQTYMAEEQNREIETTVRKEGGRLLNFIRKQVAAEADAQDILQDTLEQLVGATRGLASIERMTSWLFRVARNKIADLYRRQSREAAQPYDEEEEDAGPGLQDLLPALGDGPEELLMRETILDAIEEAIEELPAAQREVFIWHEVEGISFREIATFTGETENTLRMRKYHAVQALRSSLLDLYNDL